MHRQRLNPLKCYQSYFAGDEKYNFPERVILEFTNHCNLSCLVCPSRFLDAPKGFLTKELFTKVIDEISAYPATALIPFFRGESLLHPEFISMMRYIKAKGIAPVQLATNGNLLSGEIIDTILELNIDFISISLDAIDKHIYSKMRRGGDFNLVIKNIDNLLGKRNKLKRQLPQIQISIVETKETRKTIKDFLEKWIRKVDRVRIYREHSCDGNFGSLKASLKGVPQERKPCLKPLKEIAIYWNGDVAICNHDWDRQQPLGNIGELTIYEIWNGKRYRQLRERHFFGKDRLDSLCRKCDHWKAYYLPSGIIGRLYAPKKHLKDKADT